MCACMCKREGNRERERFKNSSLELVLPFEEVTLKGGRWKRRDTDDASSSNGVSCVRTDRLHASLSSVSKINEKVRVCVCCVCVCEREKERGRERGQEKEEESVQNQRKK